MKTIKYHKTFGKVEVKTIDEKFLLLTDEHGVESKVLRKYVVLLDAPFVFNATDYLKNNRESIIERVEEAMKNDHYIGGSLKNVMCEIMGEVELIESEKNAEKLIDNIIYNLIDHVSVNIEHEEFVERRKRQERILFKKTN
ncbi:hypothetical protein N9H19_00790 [Flavobacteriales bacterium]|nr:hypothetical protein [Flavobacteriales bacterium]